jgi:hypothetical protein
MLRIDPRHVSIRLYPGEPHAFVVDPDGPVAADMIRRGTRMQLVSRRIVRVRSGRLLSTIRKRIGFNRRGVYIDVLAGGGGVNYAVIENDGSVPHEIAARKRKALRFVVGGRVVFRTRVWHPGTTGSGFLTKALPYGAR